MTVPKAFYVFATSSICVFAELGEQRHQKFVSAALAYIQAVNQLEHCSIDIVKEILKCASHLKSILFAFVIFKICTPFIHLFSCFYHKTPLDAVGLEGPP